MPRTNSATDPLTQQSKYVSYLLRHESRIGDLVDEYGFVNLKQLNSVVRKDGHKLLSESDLVAVTNNPNTKKRFEIEYRPMKENSSDPPPDASQMPPEQRQLFIRALNGHSFPLKSNIFEPFLVSSTDQPKYIYHVTNHRTVDTILAEGLSPMSRQFVHLYEHSNQIKYDGKRNTLLQIGPVNGSQLTLYRSKNGYIQCPHVIPPQMIQRALR